MLDHHAIQEILETALEMFQCVGISLTLTEDGRHRSFNAGYAELETKRPMTEDTILPIGSSSKAFTAEAVCLLADRGLLELDAPVKRYLPDLRMYDKYAEDHLTVRDLLCHRCGLPRHDFLWYAHENYMEKELIDALPYLKPFTSFREKYHYNNLMFAVAGYLIETVSGKSWDQFVADELVKPMGAANISFNVDDLQRSGAAAAGYGYDRREKKFIRLPYKQLHGIRAAGSINGSTSQMVKWIDLQLNLGKVGDHRLLKEESIRECHMPQTIMGHQPLSLPGCDFECYGLGWMMQRQNGLKLVHHGGNIDGFAAMHFFLPEQRWGASILTNSVSTARSAVMYALVDLSMGRDWRATMQTIRELLDRTQTEMDAARESALREMPKIPQMLPNAALVGIYEHPGYGKLTVSDENGCLFASIGALHMELKHLAQEIFEIVMEDEERFVLQFTLDLQGQVTACEIDLEPMIGEPIRFARK